MATHTAYDSRGNELVTWNDGELSGDPTIIGILNRAAERELVVGMVECDPETLLGFRAACSLVLGDDADIRPPIENLEGEDL